MTVRWSDLRFSCISTDIIPQSVLCQQLWGDEVRTELRAAGRLAGASRPGGHFSVSRPSAETAVRPQQGEISGACFLITLESCLLCITDAAFLTAPLVSGTRNSCLQTLSAGRAYTSVKLGHPPAVYQCSSQQAQRLQVDLFWFQHFFSRCFVSNQYIKCPAVTQL